MIFPTRLALLTAAALTLASAGAAQAPGLSQAERREGAAANPQLTAQFGGAYPGPQAAYVRSVGRRIAMQSGLAARPDDYTVTLLNSNINNAFAIPGGYVYVTRQLVALMNDEAELAFVLGHEVAHVAARHADKRAKRSGLAGLGAAILGAVTGSSVIGNLAGTGAQLYSLNYSRSQEREADSLGVRYLARAGYDPAASADILAELGAQTNLEARLSGQGGKAPAPWLSTHPANAERVAEVRRQAAALGKSGATNRDAFLDAIDGMAYDDDPAQGIVQGTRFRHAGLGLAFDAPPGFALQNSPSAVNGSKQGAGRFTFGGGRVAGTDLAAYARTVWQGLGATTPELRARRINGVDALIGQTRVQRSDGAIDASVIAYQFGADSFYHIVMLAPANGLPVFAPLIESVRRLGPADAAATRGRRVKVVRVAAGDTVASLAARMAYDDDRMARFTILNGITAATRLVPGSRVKLIVAG
ncbi:M48 family metalloprotease [Polymorphobacter fuscus]|uniref:M48 family metalloprotease n=1 Tax=Sandarakinorhabdus fusca TaxID=1439888 RepID=A0A7C9KX24_9SPHN|nr:M48 family metalloprotease [Polymorphobacter fuscus]KAB7647820.1 M48 family metalloprotease [Polymorphobacter fuscus]MQT17122.1 M48 family metalloprotease [Polymorphobacter fuscus]NJC08886.1 putative Zn-dependent protease [Polymorphobacter fuscus]